MSKTTKMDNYQAVRDYLKEGEKSDLVTFIEHEMELLAKKNAARSDKPTKAQKENANIATDILAKMTAGKWYRCSEIKALNDDLAKSAGTQRTSAICNALVAEGKLAKTTEKRVVYFALAE